MASAAEQLAANLSLGSFSRATELKQRLWFTLGAVVVYRAGTFIPIPGVDGAVVADSVHSYTGGFLDLLDTYSGGGLGRAAIFALSIVPYISASIVVAMLTAWVPSLEARKNEGEMGRRQLNRYIRTATAFIALLESYGLAVTFESMHGPFGPAVLDPGWLFRISCVISLTGGAMFVMWLVEEVSARGVGNGMSLLLAVGILANQPSALASLFNLGRTGGISAFAILAIVIAGVVLVAAIVFVERAQRRIPVQYPKRQSGNRMFGGDSTNMPLKINSSGVFSPIVALSLLPIPVAIASLSVGGPGWLQAIAMQFAYGRPGYMIIFAALRVFFAYLYTASTFNAEETADNLKKYGGFVPGIRPGGPTAAFFDRIATRLTAAGCVYLVAVCILPELLISDRTLSFYLSGTAVLMIVLTTMDTVTQIQSFLLAHQYEGLIRKTKAKGRR
jgi:preprotein translocase subunit SecY